MATRQVEQQFGEGSADSFFSPLPDDLIEEIVSWTTPQHAIELSRASPDLKRACDSDYVWGVFLRFILASGSSGGCSSLAPRRPFSRKELFLHLCSLSLDRCSRKICIMLSAEILTITWSDIPVNWLWERLPESRFDYVAKLKTVRRLEIRCKISSSLLSPGTHYAAYLVFKFAIDPLPYGFEGQSVEVGAGFVGEGGNQGRSVDLWSLYCLYIAGDFPEKRHDSWLEIELGEFFVKAGDRKEVQMRVLETVDGAWKGGLIIEGIEIRPKERREGK